MTEHLPWIIDTRHSEVRFTARQMGMTVRGRFSTVRGSIDLSLDRPEASSVEATIETGSVEPAMAALTGLLMSDGFLAAQEHPELRFRSHRVVPAGERYLVHGDLEFRGEVRPVEFETWLTAGEDRGPDRFVTVEARGRVDHLMADEELEIELTLRAVPVPLAGRDHVVPRAPEAIAARTNRSRPDQPIRLVALLGSLRRASLNRALLDAAVASAPRGVSIHPFSLADVPFYDGDLDVDGGPPAVRALKQAIRAADGVLIVTPEYNHGLPAIVKNAIDWASRPVFDSVLAGKPVLLMGATTGRSAVKHALGQAAETLAVAQALPFEEHLGVARAGDLIDGEGRLAEPAIDQRLGALLSGFRRFVADTSAKQRAVA